jgi:alpha-L-fucosidase
MGYILFLTKHHDGFCLWDTQTTDRKVTKAPLGRDVLAELRKSCDRYGIKLALYFSEGEWDWPNKPDGTRFAKNGGYNPEMKKAQLKELCTQYGPIEFFWMDHAAGNGGLSHKETFEWVKSFQPGCFVGFNHGEVAGELRAGELGRPGKVGPPYLLGEFTYPILPSHQGGAMWFYSLPVHDRLCHPAEKIYLDYLTAVKHGNIFSLDAGPDYSGQLRQIDVETLRKVGELIRQTLPTLPPPLSKDKPAKASSVWHAPGYEADKAFDDDNATRWGAAQDAGGKGWLEVDLGQPTTFNHAVILEGEWNRVRQFEVQIRDGDAWKTIASGTTLGVRKQLDFKPVVARFVRLNILEAAGVPTIWEFQLFNIE